MPVYDYAPTSGRCDQCNGRFEAFQRLADPKLTECPTCGQACERLVSAAGLVGSVAPNVAVDAPQPANKAAVRMVGAMARVLREARGSRTVRG